jgi:hypothetical protein
LNIEKKEKGGVRPAIRELSKESGIPQGTLKRWYYPECPKNGTPKEACNQIDRRKEKEGGVRKTLRKLSKESGIPYGTLRDWYYPPKAVPKIRNKTKPTFETCAISDLQSLIGSGKKFNFKYLAKESLCQD